MYFITSRLYNSIPIAALEELKSIKDDTNDIMENRLFKKYDSLIDSGEFGEKYLSIASCAEIVKSCLHFTDEKDYNLICYCIMPNHFHLVFELRKGNKGISKIMQSIKRISARKCNQILNREGKFWQDESYDRRIRSNKELYFIIQYVLLNPVNAGLVKNWFDWKYAYCHKDYLII